MTPENILIQLNRRIAENPAPTALSRALAKEFPPERIAEMLSKLPTLMREKLILDYLDGKPVRRTIRIICKK